MESNGYFSGQDPAPGASPGPSVGHDQLWMAGIVLVAAAARLLELSRQSLWYDEAFSWIVATVPWDLSWQAILVDGNHPPLFYLLQRAALSSLGQSEFSVRLVSAAFGVLCIPVAYQVSRLLFGRRIGLLAALLLAVSPFHAWLSQEARMYTAVTFFCLLAAYFLWQLLGGRDNWAVYAGFVLSSALAYWTDFSAFLFALVQLVYFTLTVRDHRKILRRWFVLQAIAGLIILPWFVVLRMRQSQSFGFAWIVRPEPIDLANTIWNFALGYTGELSLLTLVALSLVAWLLGRSFYARSLASTSARLFAHLWLWLPLLFTWLFSVAVVPVYIDRFLMVSQPALAMLLAYGLDTLQRPWRRLSVAALLVVTVLSLGRLYLDPQYYTKEDWRQVTAYVSGHERPGDTLILPSFPSTIPLSFYYRGSMKPQMLASPDGVHSPAELVQGYRRAWWLLSHFHDSRHYLAKAGPVDDGGDLSESAKWLNAHSNGLLDEAQFAGLTLRLYDLSDPSGR